MNRILVVGSVHNPDVAAPEELLWILRRLQPDVLFLEHPLDEIERIHNESCKTLECLAVRGYLRLHEATVVPVDVSRATYEHSEASMKAMFDEMFAAAESTSDAYRHLSQVHALETALAGFAYLNSQLAWQNEVALRHELARALSSLKAARITTHFDLWSRFHERREHAMLAHIQQYVRGHALRKAVLVVGSAHRPPLKEKLQQGQYRELAALRWEFAWDLVDDPTLNGPRGNP